jgi:hypothetical protein
MKFAGVNIYGHPNIRDLIHKSHARVPCPQPPRKRHLAFCVVFINHAKSRHCATSSRRHANFTQDVKYLRLTTNNLFYLKLKRNRQFHRPLAEQITIRIPAPPMTDGNNYEKTFALKLFGSYTTRIVISIKLQIKYI